MPLYPDAKTRIVANLEVIAEGGRVALIAVGMFTEQQFADLNAVRRGLSLHEIESREIVFIGRHIYARRSKDGYTVEDMVLQIESALSRHVRRFRQSKNDRHEQFGWPVRWIWQSGV